MVLGIAKYLPVLGHHHHHHHHDILHQAIAQYKSLKNSENS